MAANTAQARLLYPTPNRATLDRLIRARVAELADAPVLGAGSRKAVWVRVPPFALFDSPFGPPFG